MGEQSGPSDEDIDVESTNEEPTPTTKEEFDSQQNAEEDQPKTTGADSSSDEWQYLDNTVLDEAYSLQNSLSIDECNGILEPRYSSIQILAFPLPEYSTNLLRMTLGYELST
jgi:hypothetical protein